MLGIGAAMLASPPAPLLARGRLQAVATFSILANFAEALADERWEVASLVGPDSDTHSYQATPSDARRVGHARLLVCNGLGLEPWLRRLAAAANFKGEEVVAAKGIAPPARAESPNSSPTNVDPHCWQDVTLARRYAANIADGFVAADPDAELRYRRRLGEIDSELGALDAWIRRQIASVPADKRRVITSHDAFGYFGRAYGVEFLPVRGLDDEREPTARQIAHLVGLLRSHKVRALFIENVGNHALVDQIAHEAGGVIGKPLYSDSLSPPSGPAATYQAMMRHNVASLVEGMLRN